MLLCCSPLLPFSQLSPCFPKSPSSFVVLGFLVVKVLVFFGIPNSSFDSTLLLLSKIFGLDQAGSGAKKKKKLLHR